jgi:hypothetical protein
MGIFAAALAAVRGFDAVVMVASIG